MDLTDKSTIITGGGSGIGKSLAKRFATAGARVTVADLSVEKATQVANEVNGLAVECDVRDEAQIENLVKISEETYGAVDLFCSNAGLAFGEPSHSASASNTVWATCWDVHVMAHVYAARAVLPSMIERGEGYLLQMASAAGLLSQIGDAAYSATKHAAVGFAESLAISHGDDGIKVSVICPQYVATPLLGYEEGGERVQAPGTLSPEDVAETIYEGVVNDRFLILTHPDVKTYIQQKAGDTDRWISGMQQLRRNIIEQTGGTDLKSLSKLL
ncbi:MAG: SDR family oxidoreductase [Pseudomonadota bacterium]